MAAAVSASLRMRASCVGCRASHLSCNGIAQTQPGRAQRACSRCAAAGNPCKFVHARRPGPPLGFVRAKQPTLKRTHAQVDSSDSDDDRPDILLVALVALDPVGVVDVIVTVATAAAAAESSPPPPSNQHWCRRVEDVLAQVDSWINYEQCA